MIKIKKGTNHISKKGCITALIPFLFSSLAVTSLFSCRIYASENDAAGFTEKETISAEKEENVFVIAGADGSVSKIIVSDWLKNTGQADALPDKTSLEDIENLKGDETWSENEDGSILWDAAGNDIFYQGISSEELPVDIQVHYFLDGEEISPEEIAGKSGDVKIRYEYQNHLAEETELDGKTTSLHVPFAAVTGILLDDNTLSDIQITNGYIATDDEHTIAIGIAFPGIAEDLKSPAYEALTKLAPIQAPDYFEISGKAENFTWGTSYTLVTNEIFSSATDDIAKPLDDVVSKLAVLKSGIDQISEGVSSLNEGAAELKKGAGDLAGSLGELTSGGDSLKNGADQLFDEIILSVRDELNTAGVPAKELTRDNYQEVLGSLSSLAKGEQKEQLDASLEKLNNIKEFCGSLTAYTEGVAKAKEGADQLSGGVNSLQSQTMKLLLGTGLLKAGIPDLSEVTNALKESLALGKNYTNYTGIAEGMTGNVRFIWKVNGLDGN